MLDRFKQLDELRNNELQVSRLSSTKGDPNPSGSPASSPKSKLMKSRNFSKASSGNSESEIDSTTYSYFNYQDNSENEVLERYVMELNSLQRQLTLNALQNISDHNEKKFRKMRSNFDVAEGSDCGSAAASLHKGSSKSSTLSSIQVLRIELSGWKKLKNDFYHKYKKTFNLSKIPDIFDCTEF